VFLAAIAGSVGLVVLFESVDRRWKWEVIGVRHPGRPYSEPFSVEDLGLVHGEAGITVLVRKYDFRPDGLYESLYAYTRDGEWREEKLAEELPPLGTQGFFALNLPELHVASWVRNDEIVAYVRDLEGGRLHRFALDATDGRGPHSIRYHVTHLSHRRPVWLTQPVTEDYSGDISIWVAARDSVSLLGSLTLPRWALLAADAPPDGILFAVAAFDLEPPQIVSVGITSGSRARLRPRPESGPRRG